MRTQPNETFNQNYNIHCKHLALKGLQPKTIEAYSRAIRSIGKFFNYDIVILSSNQLLDYFHDRLESSSWSTVKLDLYGLKFFYQYTLEKTWVDIKLIKPPKITRIPDVASINEIHQILSSTHILSYKVYFYTVYSMGLRLSEGLQIQTGDIDAERKFVHLRNAKGNKDRLVHLPPTTLHVLRKFWSIHKHPKLLFPSRQKGVINCHRAMSHLDKGGVQSCLKKVIKEMGITKHITVHSLRHSFGTHLLEAGVDLIQVQHLMGHVSLVTTTKYLHYTTTNAQTSLKKIDHIMEGFNISWGEVK